MKLLINADDFGFSRGHNLGILDCFTRGVLTSATLMTNQVGTEDAYQIAKENPTLDVGVHLVATFGKPLLSKEKVASLVDKNGNFLRLNKYESQDINSEELYLEWKKQIDRMIENGVRPTHMDSHHHVHMLPQFFPVFVALAKEYSLPIRYHQELIDKQHMKKYQELIQGLAYAESFCYDFYKEKVEAAYFERLPFDKDITVEIMTHPAYLDEIIFKNSSYHLDRMKELDILTNPTLKKKLASKQVEFITFSDLQR